MLGPCILKVWNWRKGLDCFAYDSFEIDTRHNYRNIYPLFQTFHFSKRNSHKDRFNLIIVKNSRLRVRSWLDSSRSNH